MSDFVKPHWVRFFASDFLAGCTLMPGRLRTIYAYLLILQADQGPISLSVSEIAAHIEASETDVQTVLKSKFDFNSDINAWVNERMAAEVDRAGGVLANKVAGAAKARAKKESRTEQNRTDSDIKVDINADIKTPQKGARERFQRPTLEQLRDYGLTLSPTFTDAETFFDFYETKGWKVGRTSMKDWKAAVRNWNRRNNTNGTTGGNSLDELMAKHNGR